MCTKRTNCVTSLYLMFFLITATNKQKNIPTKHDSFDSFGRLLIASQLPSAFFFGGGAITPPKYTQWRHRRANSSFISRHWVMNMSACARRIRAWNKNWVEKLRLQKPASAGQSLKQAQRKRPTLPRTCDGKETVEKIRFVFWKTFPWYWKMDEQKLAGGGGGVGLCVKFLLYERICWMLCRHWLSLSHDSKHVLLREDQLLYIVFWPTQDLAIDRTGCCQIGKAKVVCIFKS